ncbi:hypothetical protein DPMN_014184 [Dreissena polymorpha]|uniref:PH domain-containing protein n=1 Tax=Dreissena polymorpha TaxID=45954 RepID=A0A9D4S4F7_DREPO|nr:hypothetical protein DPMN_014184 [Dreissena polymorpha]
MLDIIRTSPSKSVGIPDDDDVDRDLLVGIYERVKAQEFRPGADHVTQVMKVEQTIVGKRKPALALPHRRLVCYCRLYQVHDPNKKEKIGLHQREVFLFNDLLMVTKIFSKQKSGITYSFKQSYSLCDMQVYLFEIRHYRFGIRLVNNLDNNVLIAFNARNDADRQKFVEDLKEAILEPGKTSGSSDYGTLWISRAARRSSPIRPSSDDAVKPLSTYEQLPFCLSSLRRILQENLLWLILPPVATCTLQLLNELF